MLPSDFGKGKRSCRALEKRKAVSVLVAANPRGRTTKALAMKWVLFGAVRLVITASFPAQCAALRPFHAVPQSSNMRSKKSPAKAAPGCAVLPVRAIAARRVVRYGFKAFKFPKLRVWGSVKISPGFLYPFPMLINQLHRIGGQLLFLDALIMFRVGLCSLQYIRRPVPFGNAARRRTRSGGSLERAS